MKKKSKNKDQKIKKQKSFTLKLTKFELLHLRDLMSVLLPPTGDETLSGALAKLENRSVIEGMLWKKIASSCVEARLPMMESAPDYMIAPIAPPPLGVFQINTEPDSSSSPEDSPEEEL